jgi:dihydrofolate reductase
MGKIVITEFVSLDGVIQDPGGVEGFERGGWAFEVDRGEAGDNYKLDETVNTEAVLLGRKTYEVFAASWPSRSGEFADRFNSLPKYVVSSTLEHPEWSNSTVLDGDVLDAVSRLKRQLDGDIVVHGSVQLAQTLFEHDLVDEFRLMVYRSSSGPATAFSAARRATRSPCGLWTRRRSERASPSSPTSRSETQGRRGTAPAFRRSARPPSTERASRRAPKRGAPPCSPAHVSA